MLFYLSRTTAEAYSAYSMFSQNKLKMISSLACTYLLQVGNAETDDYYDYKGLVEFAWSHSVISDQLYERVSNVCDFKLSPRSNECNHVMISVYAQYDKIDIYNIYAPKCNTVKSAQLSTSDSTAEMNAEVITVFDNF